MSKIIPLTQGKIAIVDDADYDKVVRFKWYAVKNNPFIWYAKTGVTIGYTHNPRKKWMGHMLLHRFLLHPPIGKEVDHINNNSLDCRRANMRICTHTQNIRNNAPMRNKSSKYKGVHWATREKRWVAKICIESRTLCLGYFRDEAQAVLAYNHAAIRAWGEYAYINTVDGIGRDLQIAARQTAETER